MNEARELKAVAKPCANGVEVSVIVPVPGVEPDPVQGSPEMTMVKWGKRKFFFTPMQRSVVMALMSAREEGLPWISHAALLEIAESEGSRLRDVFRGHPAWGTMIVQGHLHGGKAGMFAIIDPPNKDE